MLAGITNSIMEQNIIPTTAAPAGTGFAEVARLIRDTRNRVFRSANTALIDLYWKVGEYVSNKIAAAGWGKGVVQQLSEYIEKTMPGIKGFSASNIWRMTKFYDTYVNDYEKLATMLREINWSINIAILTRCKSDLEREFYIRKCLAERYTFRELNRQIDSALFERTMLAKPQASPVVSRLMPMAEKVFHDTYVLEFLGAGDAPKENDLRHALISQMKRFVLEAGRDFIFMGEEYRLQVGGSDFRIDLLFYHREMQCLVAFELKTESFRPEHLGQLNFYLEALDRDVKKPKENPSIGVLLCKDKDDTVVEYALSRSLSPTLVTQYQLCLPDKRLLREKMNEIYDSFSAN